MWRHAGLVGGGELKHQVSRDTAKGGHRAESIEGFLPALDQLQDPKEYTPANGIGRFTAFWLPHHFLNYL